MGAPIGACPRLLRGCGKTAAIALCAIVMSCTNGTDARKQAVAGLGRLGIPPPAALLAFSGGGKDGRFTRLGPAPEPVRQSDYASVERVSLNLGIRLADALVAIRMEDPNAWGAMDGEIRALSAKVDIALEKSADANAASKPPVGWKQRESDLMAWCDQFAAVCKKRGDYDVLFYCSLGVWTELIANPLAAPGRGNRPGGGWQDILSVDMVKRYLCGLESVRSHTAERALIESMILGIGKMGVLVIHENRNGLSPEAAGHLQETAGVLRWLTVRP